MKEERKGEKADDRTHGKYIRRTYPGSQAEIMAEQEGVTSRVCGRHFSRISVYAHLQTRQTHLLSLSPVTQPPAVALFAPFLQKGFDERIIRIDMSGMDSRSFPFNASSKEGLMGLYNEISGDNMGFRICLRV